jgi:hypothetical protein
MLMRHGTFGLPLIRTCTGIGLRQPLWRAAACAALTSTYGLPPRVFIEEIKRN